MQIAYRNFHRMPDGMEPGLAVSHVMQVPTGGTLPTADGRVQMYPCFSFEFHLSCLPSIPISAREFKRYLVGHDCGTVINPKIVRGMTMGGIAHGIGAALYEEFAYDGEGQLIAQSFMDYLLPSSHEVRRSRSSIMSRRRPHGARPEGLGRIRLSGRAGRDRQCGQRCAQPLGVSINTLPLKLSKLGDLIAEARAKKGH